tara:strand:+ start:225 stop:506 length:282 start_codon:yes stop_codon:yes gene_type:complete
MFMLTSTTLKDCRKAVNQASFSPTAQRKANAIKMLAKLTQEITDLKTIVIKKKAKAKAKATTKAKTPDLSKMTKAQLMAMLSPSQDGDSPTGK